MTMFNIRRSWSTLVLQCTTLESRRKVVGNWKQPYHGTTNRLTTWRSTLVKMTLWHKNSIFHSQKQRRNRMFFSKNRNQNYNSNYSQIKHFQNQLLPKFHFLKVSLFISISLNSINWKTDLLLPRSAKIILIVCELIEKRLINENTSKATRIIINISETKKLDFPAFPCIKISCKIQKIRGQRHGIEIIRKIERIEWIEANWNFGMEWGWEWKNGEQGWGWEW